MYSLLLILLILNGLFLSVVILLQSGKGGGLASMGGGAGTDTLIGGRQAATLLTKATWAGGASFMVLALVLSVLSSRQRAPESILRQEFRPQPTTTAPAPILPTQPATTPSARGTAPQTPPQGRGQAPTTSNK